MCWSTPPFCSLKALWVIFWCAEVIYWFLSIIPGNTWVLLKPSVIGICLFHVGNYDHLCFAMPQFALRAMRLWKVNMLSTFFVFVRWLHSFLLATALERLGIVLTNFKYDRSTQCPELKAGSHIRFFKIRLFKTLSRVWLWQVETLSLSLSLSKRENLQTLLKEMS
jgi:hypothetical protein